MIPTLIKVDLEKKPWEVPGHQFHNRFHPEIPPVCQVKEGEVFKVECFDAFGGQILNNDNLDDAPNWDLNFAHILSGPISVEGAEPGDILEVELLDIEPHPEMPWGFTCILPGNGGFLSDIFTQPAKCIWDINGIFATSRHIPAVKFPGIMHPGVVATAPSKELMDEWNRREAELAKSTPPGKTPLALLPEPKGALLGLLDLNEGEAERVKREAVRSIPPRECGGNGDIKNLHKGSRTWLPVLIHGANLSVGDPHFSQGDGEMALCGAIETAAVLTMRTKLIKNGMALYGMKRAPMFLTGPVEPHFSKFLTFEGINVDDNGHQSYIDPALQAALSAIEYIQKFGYSKEQAYIFLSSCPIESRIASIVDFPNVLVTLGIPTEVFDFDIEPNIYGPVVHVNGSHPPEVVSAKK